MSVILREGKISPVISVTRYLIIGGYCILLWVPLLLFPINWTFMVFLGDESEIVLYEMEMPEVKISIPLANLSIEDPLKCLIGYWIKLAKFTSSAQSIFFFINLILGVGFLLDPVAGYIVHLYHKTIGYVFEKAHMKKRLSIGAGFYLVVAIVILLLSKILTPLNFFIWHVIAFILIFGVPYAVWRKYIDEERVWDQIEPERKSKNIKKKKEGVWGVKKEEGFEKWKERFETAKNEKEKKKFSRKIEKRRLKKKKELQQILPIEKTVEKYYEFIFKDRGRANRYDSLINWRWRTSIVLTGHLIVLFLAALNLIIFLPRLGVAGSEQPHLRSPDWRVALLFILFCTILVLYFIPLIKVIRIQDLDLRSFKETSYTLFHEKTREELLDLNSTINSILFRIFQHWNTRCIEQIPLEPYEDTEPHQKEIEVLNIIEEILIKFQLAMTKFFGKLDVYYKKDETEVQILQRTKYRRDLERKSAQLTTLIENAIDTGELTKEMCKKGMDLAKDLKILIRIILRIEKS